MYKKNTVGEAVSMIMAFMNKHNCTESNLIIDVQGDAAITSVFNLNKNGVVLYTKIQESNVEDN